MKLKDNEVYLFMVKYPRTGKELYFEDEDEAIRVSVLTLAKEPERLLFNTDYPLPHIEDGKQYLQQEGIAQAQQKQIIEGHKWNERRQQEGVAVQLDYQSAHNDATKWQEEFNSARCYLELEKKVEGLEAAARFWQDKYGSDIADVRAKEIESLRALNDALAVERDNERILRYAAEAERNAETDRCAKIAREYPLSPVVGKAIAALIMDGHHHA